MMRQISQSSFTISSMNMTTIFDLTKPIYIQLIGRWITTEELAVLDTAICNKVQRNTHIERCLDSTTLGTTNSTLTLRIYLEWITSKGLALETLQLFLQNADSENILANLKCGFLTTFQILCGRDATKIDESIIVHSFPPKFNLLSTLLVHRVSYIRDEWVVAAADHCPLLQHVELSRVEVSDASLKHLAARCPLLRVLSVKHCNIGVWREVTLESARTVVELCPDLQSIVYDVFEYSAGTGTLKVNSTATDLQFDVLLEIFPSVQGLNLVLEKLSLKALETVRTRLAHSLQTFEMRICSKSLVEIEAQMVAIAQSCSLLRTVTLNCDLLIRGVLSLLNHLPHMQFVRTKSVLYSADARSLELKAHGGAQITDKEVRELVGYPFVIHDVDRVTLEDCGRVTDAALAHIAEVFGPNLRGFTLLQCGAITDKGLINMLERCDQLSTLYVSNCKQITNAACSQLPQQCRQMRSLSWNNYSHGFLNAATHLSVPVVTQIAELWRDLRIVSLIGGGSCIPYSVLAALVTHCPELTAVETTHLEYSRGQHIHFSGCDAVDVDAELSAFSLACAGQRIADLRVLSCPHVTDDAVCALLDVHGQTLTAISIVGCPRITEKSLYALLEKDCALLESLSVFGAKTSGNTYLPTVMRHCDRLSEFQNDCIKYARAEHALTVKGASVSNAELLEILSVAGRLHTLEVSGAPLLDDDTVEQITAAYGAHITAVQFKQCDMLTERAVRAVVSRCQGLLRLDLTDCLCLKNECAVPVAEQCRSLQSFILGCADRDHSFDEHLLAIIERNRFLKHLFVTGGDTDALFAETLAASAIRRHPKIKVYA